MNALQHSTANRKQVTMALEKRKQARSHRVRKLRIEISPMSWIFAALTVAGTWLLLQLAPVALVLIAALMIVGAVTPVVEWLRARGASRPVAIVCAFIAMLLTVVAAATLTLPAIQAQVVDLVQQEPQLREKLAVWLESYPITASWAAALRAVQYQELVGASASHILAYSKRALEVVAYLAGAFFLALYMMMDRDRLRGALFGAVPRCYHVRLARVLLKLQTIVGGYIRGQLITCLLASVFLFILLVACGVPNAVALAVFGGIADVLPFVGAILMIVPSALAAMSKGPLIVGIIVAAILAYQEFESRVLVPLVYGRALRLPSSVVLFSIIAGASLYGVVGALLALPLAATLLMLVEELNVEMPGEEGVPEKMDVREEVERDEEEYQKRAQGLPADRAAQVAVRISQRADDDRRGG
jgi:putative heme transporter